LPDQDDATQPHPPAAAAAAAADGESVDPESPAEPLVEDGRPLLAVTGSACQVLAPPVDGAQGEELLHR
jgi:hypothetical protein